MPQVHFVAHLDHDGGMNDGLTTPFGVMIPATNLTVALTGLGCSRHLMLAEVDGDVHRRIESRFCRSLGDAWLLLAHWQVEHGVAPENVRDNSGIDLGVLFAHIEIDLDDVSVNEVAGVIR